MNLDDIAPAGVYHVTNAPEQEPPRIDGWLEMEWLPDGSKIVRNYDLDRNLVSTWKRQGPYGGDWAKVEQA